LQAPFSNQLWNITHLRPQQDAFQRPALVSMGGLNEEVFTGFLSRSALLQSVCLAVEHDEAGEDFVTAIKAKMPAQELYLPTGKDLNEHLCYNTNR
jgi:hypothetical protein